MKQYLDLVRHVLETGVPSDDRTGTGTLSVFGWQSRYNLRDGFPLLTTKKLWFRGIAEELFWLLSGSTNVKDLQDKGVKIWDEWAPENGDLGPVYGHQWRKWPGNLCVNRVPIGPEYDAHAEGSIYTDASAEKFYERHYLEPIDQITNVIERIKTKPDCRRLIVSAWNPADVDKMALPPCHCFFQFYTRVLSLFERSFHAPVELRGAAGLSHELLDEYGVPRRGISCQLYQRSADLFLGVPYNIASYSLLTMMVAQVVNMVPLEFIHTFGNAHIYNNHIEQMMLQLTRDPRPLPKLELNPHITNIFDFNFDDLRLTEYDPHDHIAGDVSV